MSKISQVIGYLPSIRSCFYFSEINKIVESVYFSCGKIFNFLWSDPSPLFAICKTGLLNYV